jgi:D-glycero-alpha-D-manno-heptose-7-phosphate kinase
MMIEASAPVRICDNGGWTDTWFGGPGRILNIAVKPGVEVSIHTTAGPDRVVFDVVAFGERYSVIPNEPRVARHPLLEAAIDEFAPPRGVALEISVHSGVPAGCGTGTSAAIAVALLGGLAALRGDRCTRRDIAYAAHRLEVDILGVESGIQDQLSAALGGVNYIEVETYPQAKVSRLPTWEELNSSLTLVFLGRAHDSPAVHRRVIEDAGNLRSGVFVRLRDAAVAARDAILAQDLAALGQAMIANTEAQGSLHPGIVGADARRVIELAAAQGAVGWKVNGAGGDGGSVTILSQSRAAKAALEPRIAALDRRYRLLPVEVSDAGLEVRRAV